MAFAGLYCHYSVSVTLMTTTPRCNARQKDQLISGDWAERAGPNGPCRVAQFGLIAGELSQPGEGVQRAADLRRIDGLR